MIVVDTNVIQYCWVNGQHTLLAQAVRQRDADWHAPILWRSEFRNILATYLRTGALSRAQAGQVMQKVRQAMLHGNHVVEDDRVLEIVATSPLTAYDAEFVSLAQALAVPLVTADRAILKAFPREAIAMDRFVESG